MTETERRTSCQRRANYFRKAATFNQNKDISDAGLLTNKRRYGNKLCRELVKSSFGESEAKNLRVQSVTQHCEQEAKGAKEPATTLINTKQLE